MISVRDFCCCLGVIFRDNIHCGYLPAAMCPRHLSVKIARRSSFSSRVRSVEALELQPLCAKTRLSNLFDPPSALLCRCSSVAYHLEGFFPKTTNTNGRSQYQQLSPSRSRNLSRLLRRCLLCICLEGILLAIQKGGGAIPRLCLVSGLVASRRSSPSVRRLTSNAGRCPASRR